MPTDWGGGAGEGIARTLADLGRINADRALTQGQIWGGAAQNIGNLIAQAPQRAALQDERQARAMELQGLAQDRQYKAQLMQRDQAGSEALAKAISDPANQGDPEKVYQAVAGAGFPEHAQKYLDAATKHKETLDKLTALKGAEHDAVAEILSGADGNDRADVESRLGLIHQRGFDATPWAQRIDAAPDPQKGIQTIIDTSPTYSKAARTRAEKAAEEAAKVTVGHPGDVFFKGGQQVGSVPDRPKERVPAAAGSFEDYVARKYGPDATPDQILAARKAYQQADDRPPKAAAAAASPTAASGGLDEGGLELAATRFRLTGALPARDSKQNAAIMNAAAQQGKALGNSPAATIQKQAAYKGDSAALALMEKSSASAEAYENKAIAQTDIIRDLSAKVPRTRFPFINAALQAGRTEITGDENATKFANAVETFSEEYAKVMSGATGSAAASSDSVRAASKRLINAAMSQGTMAGVLDLMQKEMDLTLKGYDVTKQHITEKMGGSSANTSKTADPLGIR